MHRILPFDDRAGLIWAELMAHGKATGRARSVLDMIIAAVARANECVVVTDNERDFAGIRIFQSDAWIDVMRPPVEPAPVPDST